MNKTKEANDVKKNVHELTPQEHEEIIKRFCGGQLPPHMTAEIAHKILEEARQDLREELAQKSRRDGRLLAKALQFRITW